MKIEMDKMDKGFGKKRVVWGVWFEVVRGEVEGVMGENGGGK
ncbi:hypothetical protein [Bacillus pumilus]|nr:hypothetical protein [Bacillus pumilus]